MSKKRERGHNEWKSNTEERRRKFNYYNEQSLSREDKYKPEKGDEYLIVRGDEYWKKKVEELEKQMELENKRNLPGTPLNLSHDTKSKGKKKKTRKRRKKRRKKRKSTIKK